MSTRQYDKSNYDCRYVSLESKEGCGGGVVTWAMVMGVS